MQHAFYSSFIPRLLALYLALLNVNVSVIHAMVTFALVSKCEIGEEQVIVSILRIGKVVSYSKFFCNHCKTEGSKIPVSASRAKLGMVQPLLCSTLLQHLTTQS